MSEAAENWSQHRSARAAGLIARHGGGDEATHLPGASDCIVLAFASLETCIRRYSEGQSSTDCSVAEVVHTGRSEVLPPTLDEREGSTRLGLIALFIRSSRAGHIEQQCGSAVASLKFNFCPHRWQIKSPYCYLLGRLVQPRAGRSSLPCPHGLHSCTSITSAQWQ